MSQAAIFSLISAIMTVVVLPILSVVLHKNTRKKNASAAQQITNAVLHSAFNESINRNNPPTK